MGGAMTHDSVEAIAKEILGRSGSSLTGVKLSEGIWTIGYEHPKCGGLQATAADTPDVERFKKQLGEQVGYGIAITGPDVDMERARTKRRRF
jgi:hypothetical protein